MAAHHGLSRASLAGCFATTKIDSHHAPQQPVQLIRQSLAVCLVKRGRTAVCTACDHVASKRYIACDDKIVRVLPDDNVPSESPRSLAHRPRSLVGVKLAYLVSAVTGH
jgi:hypothetical protein